MRLDARLLTALTDDARAAFLTWVRSLTPDADREDGPSFEQWLVGHAKTPGDAVWAFYDTDSGALLGTASLVGQDQQLLAPADGWVLGGVNVVRERRGQGVGGALLTWLEAELLRRAAALGRPVPILLQADDPVAIRLYIRHGFVELPDRPGVYGRRYPLRRNGG